MKVIRHFQTYEEEETKLDNSKIRPKGWSEKYTGPTALCSAILQTAVNYQIKTEEVVRCLGVVFTCYWTTYNSRYSTEICGF